MAGFAADISVISPHFPAISSTVGTWSNVDAVGLEQRGALHLAAADDEDRVRVRHLFGAQVRHHRRHVFGGQLLQDFFGRMSSVMRVAAIGATALVLMLYFAPSWASVLISPTRPSLAAP